MTFITDWENLGVFPLQDHSDHDPDIDLRYMVVGGRIEHVDDKTGEPRLEKSSLGDVHPWRLWPASDRHMGSWAQVFASVSLGSSGGSSGDPGGGTADGAGGDSIGTGQPGTHGAGRRPDGSRSLGVRRTGGASGIAGGPLRVGVQPGGAVRTHRDVTPSDGGGGGGGTQVIPLFSPTRGDRRYLPIHQNLPPCWPLIPEGFMGVALVGTDERSQQDIWFPVDPRLVAPHAGGPPEMGTIVTDLQPDRRPNSGRAARLQSLVQVVLLEDDVKISAKGAALALNFKSTTQDRIGGFGLSIGKGDTSRDPVKTPGEGPGEPGGGKPVTGAEAGANSADGAAGAVGDAGASGPPSGSGESSAPGRPKEWVKDSNGQWYRYDPGTGGYRGWRTTRNDPFPPGLGGSRTADPWAASHGGRMGPHGAVTPGRGGGGGGGSDANVCGGKDPESLKDTKNVVFFLARDEAFGPIHPGHVNDKHHHGKTFDGQPVNAGHIHDEAFFYQTRDRDGPLWFTRFDYPHPNRLPGIGRVFLTWDAKDKHAFKQGERDGKWKWYCEIPDFYSGPDHPPEPTDPDEPPGGGGPPNEPTDPEPPSSKTPTTPPGTPYPVPTEPTDPGVEDVPFPHFDDTSRPCGGGSTPSTPPGAPARPSDPSDVMPTTPTTPGSPRFGDPSPIPGYPFGYGSKPPEGFIPGWTVVAAGGRSYDRIERNGALSHISSSLVGPAFRNGGMREETVMRAMASGFASIHFRPQRLAPGEIDYRFTSAVDRKLMAKDDETRPTVARLEAFGAGQRSAAGWIYNVTPQSSRFKGGEAAGGAVFLPPYLDIADVEYDLDLSGEGQPSDVAPFVLAPGTMLAWGVPDVDTGGLKACAWAGRRTPTGSYSTLSFESYDGTSWTGVFSMLKDANGLGAKVHGTGYLTVPSGTTAQRPATPATGMLRHNSTTGGAEMYFGGAWNALGGGSSTGKLVAVTVYDTAGTDTHSWNADATSAIVVVVGGGGGGGGCAGATASQSAVAGGGAAGGFLMHRYTSLPTDPVDLTVGAAGAAGASGGGAGGAGGDSSFDDSGTPLTAKGGGGGQHIAESASAGAAAGGTTAVSTGSPNMVTGGGNPGEHGIKLAGAVSIGGNGGCSHLGGAGGQGGINDTAGNDGIGPGSGGGGASTTSASANHRAGGAGKAGIIIVYEYS